MGMQQSALVHQETSQLAVFKVLEQSMPKWLSQVDHIMRSITAQVPYLDGN